MDKTPSVSNTAKYFVIESSDAPLTYKPGTVVFEKGEHSDYFARNKGYKLYGNVNKNNPSGEDTSLGISPTAYNTILRQATREEIARALEND